MKLEHTFTVKASLDESWEYVKGREAFGSPIAQYQGVMTSRYIRPAGASQPATRRSRRR